MSLRKGIGFCQQSEEWKFHSDIIRFQNMFQYKPGDKIPSEPQLVNTYNISRVTVRNAIQQLVNDGVLIKKHGKGTFVKSAVYTEGFFSGGSFTETCLQMKATPYTHIISIDKEKADEQIHSILNEKMNSLQLNEFDM